MSTGGCDGPGSSAQAQCTSPATAITAQAKAGTTSFTVSSRKNASVKSAAMNGAAIMNAPTVETRLRRSQPSPAG